MSPSSKRSSPITSREVKALLHEADELFAEGARLQTIAKDALVEHFRHEVEDVPTAQDRVRRARMSRKQRKK